MTQSEPVERRYLEAATAYLERAVAADDAREAIRVLELVGRELLAHGERDEAVVTPAESFAAALAEHPGLIARAARSLGMFAEMDGAEAFPEMLYARSGYQALVDAGVWPAHPVRLEHLEESDEEIADAVAEVGVSDTDIPPWVPPSHTWWPRRGTTGRV